MNTKYYVTSAGQALIASALIVALLGVSYFFIEPRVGRAQDTSGPFTISQVITGETSFLVDAQNVSMVGSLNGITGGTAHGSTTVSVRTNSPTGYTMTIAYFNNGTTNTMQGNNTDSTSIQDYPAVANEPTYAFSTASSAAVFGYTVTALNDLDLDDSFLDDGAGNCNEVAGTDTNGTSTCWMEPRVSSFQIIDRDSDAVTGATSTLHFRVYVPNNPSPGLVADTYVATATLTVAPQ